MEEIRTLAAGGATMDEIAAEILKKAKVSSDLIKYIANTKATA